MIGSIAHICDGWLAAWATLNPGTAKNLVTERNTITFACWIDHGVKDLAGQ
jgi:hypothetical protein